MVKKKRKKKVCIGWVGLGWGEEGVKRFKKELISVESKCLEDTEGWKEEAEILRVWKEGIFSLVCV